MLGELLITPPSVLCEELLGLFEQRIQLTNAPVLFACIVRYFDNRLEQLHRLGGGGWGEVERFTLQRGAPCSHLREIRVVTVHPLFTLRVPETISHRLLRLRAGRFQSGIERLREELAGFLVRV